MIMPSINPLKVLADEVVYQEGDHAEELFMIKEGNIHLAVDIYQFLKHKSPVYNKKEPKDDEEEEEFEMGLTQN